MVAVAEVPAGSLILIGLTDKGAVTVTFITAEVLFLSTTVIADVPAEYPITVSELPVRLADAACEEMFVTLYGAVPPLTVAVAVVPAATVTLAGLIDRGAVTLTLIAAVKPFLSVTVTVAVPAATPVMVTVLPLIDAVATPALEDITEYAAVPPLIDAVADFPVMTLMLAGLTTKGAVTVTLIVAVKPFLSVTVMVAVPAATPVMVTVLPLIDAVATPALEDDTAYAAVPPLIDAVADLPDATITPDGLTAKGAITVTMIDVVKPFLSVTVMVAVPAATPVMVTVLPLIDAVATPVFEDITAYAAVPPLIAAVAVFPVMTLTLAGLTTKGATTVTLVVAVVLFLSVTVMVAVPAATPLMVTVLPLTDAVATPALEDDTAYAATPPLMVTEPVLPAATTMLVGLTANGAVTDVLIVAVKLLLSVTVIVVEPAATPVMVTVLPLIDAVAAAALEDDTL